MFGRSFLSINIFLTTRKPSTPSKLSSRDPSVRNDSMTELKRSDNEQKRRLLDSEWMIIISLMLVMASFAIIAKVNAFRTSSILKENFIPHHALCEIVIDGEVAKPGTFMVPPGTPLKKVLKKSSPTPFADLKQIDENRGVEESAHYKIERLTEISVRIEGLPSGTIDLVVPAGTRMCNLRSYICLDVDRKYLISTSRRMLRDREIISIEKTSNP